VRGRAGGNHTLHKWAKEECRTEETTPVPVSSGPMGTLKRRKFGSLSKSGSSISISIGTTFTFSDVRIIQNIFNFFSNNSPHLNTTQQRPITSSLLLLELPQVSAQAVETFRGNYSNFLFLSLYLLY